MNILVVLGHPGPKSLNAAIAKTSVETLRGLGHEVVFHDLYDEGFDAHMPVAELDPQAELDETIARHCAELSQAEGIVIVHPNWWGQPPAVLKGWVDRIFRPKVAYRFLEGDKGEGTPQGLLKARQAVVFNTANTFPEREMADFGDPLQTMWQNCIFKLCGVHEFYRRTFSVVITSTPEQRAQWLAEVGETLERLFPKDQTE